MNHNILLENPDDYKTDCLAAGLDPVTMEPVTDILDTEEDENERAEAC